MRLPSFSGHPISTDLVSVGEDVHCDFVKEQIHPGVPIGSRQTGHRVWAHNRSHVAKEISVSATILGKWVKLEQERQVSVDGRSDADIRAENARLRRELAEAKMDNEFLSKATAFFALRQRDRKNLG